MSDYNAKTTDISIVDGVSVDITVRGNEDRADKVLMDLKERLGRLGASYEEETPPAELPEYVGEEYTPLMTVDWEGVFSTEEDE